MASGSKLQDSFISAKKQIQMEAVTMKNEEELQQYTQASQKLSMPLTDYYDNKFGNQNSIMARAQKQMMDNGRYGNRFVNTVSKVDFKHFEIARKRKTGIIGKNSQHSFSCRISKISNVWCANETFGQQQQRGHICQHQSRCILTRSYVNLYF